MLIMVPHQVIREIGGRFYMYVIDLDGHRGRILRVN